MFQGRMRTALVATSMVACGTSPAGAEVLAAASRVGNFVSTVPGVFVPLTPRATAMAFDTTASNELVAITYNAECGVLGPPLAWVGVTLRVDGVEADPRGDGDFAFCMAQSTNEYAWATGTRQSTFVVPAVGRHSVTVIAQLRNGATKMWLGDSSAVVSR